MSRIGKIKIQTNNKGVIDLPIFDTSDLGSDVYDMLRVQTASGIGFVPFVDIIDSKHPYLRIQTENHGVLAAHDKPSLGIVNSGEDFYFHDGQNNILWNKPSGRTTSVTGYGPYKGVRLDDKGYVYTCEGDSVTKRKTSDLSIVWSKSHASYSAQDVEVDANGDVYAAYSGGLTSPGELRKYDSTGTEKWSDSFEGEENGGYDAPVMLAARQTEGLFVGVGNGYCMYYTNSGTRQEIFDIGGSHSYTPQSIATDGYYCLTKGQDDELWRHTPKGGNDMIANIDDGYGDICYNPNNGNWVHLGGNSIASHDASGNKLWDSPLSISDYGELVTCPNGDIMVVAGNSMERFDKDGNSLGTFTTSTGRADQIGVYPGKPAVFPSYF